MSLRHMRSFVERLPLCSHAFSCYLSTNGETLRICKSCKRADKQRPFAIVPRNIFEWAVRLSTAIWIDGPEYLQSIDGPTIDRLISRLGADWECPPPRDERANDNNDNGASPCEALIQDNEQPQSGNGQSAEQDGASLPSLGEGIGSAEPSETGPAAEGPVTATEIAAEREASRGNRDGAARADTSDSKTVEYSDDRASGELTYRSNEPADANGSASPDTLARDALDEARGEANICSQELGADPLGREGASKLAPSSPNGEESGGLVTDSPLIPTNTYGGVFSNHDLVRRRRIEQRPAAKSLAKELRRLLKEVGVGGSESVPRLDARRVAYEVVARRYQFSRAVRQDGEPLNVVFSYDVSASCAQVCSDTKAACQAIVDELGAGWLVEHSNGWLGADGGSLASEILAERGKKFLVIAFGDWDAGNDYCRIVEAGHMLVWLDSYCRKYGPRPASRKLQLMAANWKRQPIIWWQGVGNAAEAAIAIRHGCRAL